MTKLNQYTCAKCGSTITTIDLEEGVTPFMIGCKVWPTCGGQMYSHFYKVDGSPKPDYEWFKPTKAEFEELHPLTQAHVKQGGLMLRKCGGKIDELM